MNKKLVLVTYFLANVFSLCAQHKGGNNDGFGMKPSCTINLNGTSSTSLTLKSIVGSSSFCANGNENYSISVATGNAEHFYWTLPSGAIVLSGQGNNRIAMSGATNGTIKVEASNACAKVTDTMSVTAVSCGLHRGGNNDGFSMKKIGSVPLTSCKVTANAGKDTTICAGNKITLTATGGLYYKWNTGDTTALISVTPDTTTSYIVTVSNDSCSGKDSVKITVATLKASVNGNFIVCPNDSATLTAAGGTKYLWNTKDSVSTIKVLPLQDSVSYFVIVSNGICPDTTITVAVNHFDTLVTITGETNLCVGDSTTLTVSNGLNYLWNTSDTTSSIIVKPGTDKTYSVQVFNGKCKGSASTKVTVTPFPIAEAGKDTTVCAGNKVTLNASGGASGASYTWTPTTNLSSFAISNPTATAVSTTKYFVTVANGKCATKDSVTITVNPLPTVNAGSDVTVNNGDSVILQASGAINYLWQPSTYLNDSSLVSPTAKPTTTIIYVVTGTDANKCSSKDSVTIIIKELDCKEFFIPNAFSPNSNSFNDVLYVRGCPIDKKKVREASFSIYDRWGKRVFETDDITKGWDGTFDGKALNTAVFVYYMKATLTTDEVIEQKGNVSLIR